MATRHTSIGIVLYCLYEQIRPIIFNYTNKPLQIKLFEQPMQKFSLRNLNLL